MRIDKGFPTGGKRIGAGQATSVVRPALESTRVLLLIPAG